MHSCLQDCCWQTCLEIYLSVRGSSVFPPLSWASCMLIPRRQSSSGGSRKPCLQPAWDVVSTAYQRQCSSSSGPVRPSQVEQYGQEGQEFLHLVLNFGRGLLLRASDSFMRTCMQ